MRKRIFIFSTVNDRNMAHALAQVYVHIIFHVKNTGVLIRNEDKIPLYQKMERILLERKCIPLKINGIDNHVHILCSLARTITVADVVQNVKKYSSAWLKVRHPYYESFAWQTGYSCFSVSYSNLSSVEQYIVRQEQHHEVYSYSEELVRFYHACGVLCNDDSFDE